MAIAPDRVEGLSVAVLAKAPVPGQAKTRLAAVLGPVGAARLQRQLVLRTLQTVRQAENFFRNWEYVAEGSITKLLREGTCFAGW